MCKEHVWEQFGAEGEAVLNAYKQLIKDTIDQEVKFRKKLPNSDQLTVFANLISLPMLATRGARQRKSARPQECQGGGSRRADFPGRA
jgi:hypothetical protein